MRMSTTPKPLQITALFFEPGQWAVAKRLAKKRGISAGAVVREALNEYLTRPTAAGAK